MWCVTDCPWADGWRPGRCPAAGTLPLHGMPATRSTKCLPAAHLTREARSRLTTTLLYQQNGRQRVECQDPGTQTSRQAVPSRLRRGRAQTPLKPHKHMTLLNGKRTAGFLITDSSKNDLRRRSMMNPTRLGWNTTELLKSGTFWASVASAGSRCGCWAWSRPLSR